MRATELIGMEVVDERGRRLGIVLDAGFSEASWSVTAVLVGQGRRARAAAWVGAAQRRVAGPMLLRRALGRADCHVLSADDVTEWGPRQIRIRTQGAGA